MCLFVFFFFKQKTAYEMRISDWSSDVCSSDLTCSKCGGEFHVEEEAARMAPDSPLYVAPDEYPFSVLDRRKGVICPHCGHAAMVNLGKPKKPNKKVELSLLVHPQWLAGEAKQDANGQPYGGSAQDNATATTRDRKSTRLNSSH